MKLAYSAASPYVRKVNACAIARGIDGKIERWKVGTTDPTLLPFNPLSKVPTLITDDGVCLYDSPVICEYLDSIGDAPKLFPAPGPARWKALCQQALGDVSVDRHRLYVLAAADCDLVGLAPHQRADAEQVIDA